MKTDYAHHPDPAAEPRSVR